MARQGDASPAGYETVARYLIVPLKRGNARGGKGLAVEPLGQGHILRTKRRIKDGNSTTRHQYSGSLHSHLLLFLQKYRYYQKIRIDMDYENRR